MKKNILLIGMPGCGKTSLGKTLARELDMEYVDMDIYIEKKTGKRVSELFDISEDHFRNIETKISEELSKKENILVSAGGGIVLRKENINCFKPDFNIIFINRSVKNILKSKNLGKNRPLLKNNESHIYDLYNERIDLYKKYCDFEVKNDGYFRYCIEEIKNKLNT